MNQANSRKGFLHRFSVLAMVVTGAVIFSACAAPAAAPSAQSAPTAVLAAPTQAPAAPTQAAATEAPAVPTQAATTAPAPAPTEAPAEAPSEAPTGVPTEAPPAATGSAVSFSKDVVPIFEKSCIKCHGGSDGTKGGLDLRSHENLMKGGEDGAVIVTGDATNSMLVELISEGKMPKRAPKLAQEQIDLIARWVTEGALNN